MNPYYKYPLCALLALVMFGIAYLVWTRLPQDWRTRTPPEDQTGSQPSEPNQPEDPPLADPPSTHSLPGDRYALPVDVERRVDGAEDQLAKGNWVAARTLARKALDAPAVQTFDDTWLRMAEVIGKANTALLNSDIPDPEKKPYIVKSGDNLVKIAHQHQTTVGALQRANSLDRANSTIYPGNVLYMYQGGWSISVSKSQFRLVLMNGERLFKTYAVGIGRQNRTPVGVFEITSKDMFPSFRGIPYGEDGNILGTRWLKLMPIEGTDPALLGYGIHGTSDSVSETIGTAASQGCIRMLNDDVDELFDLVPMRARVAIEDE